MLFKVIDDIIVYYKISMSNFNFIISWQLCYYFFNNNNLFVKKENITLNL